LSKYKLQCSTETFYLTTPLSFCEHLFVENPTEIYFFRESTFIILNGELPVLPNLILKAVFCHDERNQTMAIFFVKTKCPGGTAYVLPCSNRAAHSAAVNHRSVLLNTNWSLPHCQNSSEQACPNAGTHNA